MQNGISNHRKRSVKSIETLAKTVHARLLKSGLTLVTAESCTGGLLAGALTALSGSSDYFRGGVVTYSNEMKTRLLGVTAGLLARHGAVSAECAEAMAHGAIRRLGGDLAVSITGIAGPTGGTVEKPVGLVHFGLAWRDASGLHATTSKRNFRGGRERVRDFAVAAALDLVRRHLIARAKE